eukprot:3911511-Rhodomonas_salina.2
MLPRRHKTGLPRTLSLRFAFQEHRTGGGEFERVEGTSPRVTQLEMMTKMRSFSVLGLNASRHASTRNGCCGAKIHSDLPV